MFMPPPALYAALLLSLPPRGAVARQARRCSPRALLSLPRAPSALPPAPQFIADARYFRADTRAEHVRAQRRKRCVQRTLRDSIAARCARMLHAPPPPHSSICALMSPALRAAAAALPYALFTFRFAPRFILRHGSRAILIHVPYRRYPGARAQKE